jgi:CheY-like chemotaxis protein
VLRAAFSGSATGTLPREVNLTVKANRNGGLLMSMSQAISSHIPYLRRFSRALTGSQSGGDAYVFATLEAIVADPPIFSSEMNVRAALYRAFLKVWGSMPVNGYVDPGAVSAEEIGARRNLEAITLRPRIAFLLRALEEFDTTAVAETLDCSIEEAASLIDAAAKEIANQIRTDVLIIEDELLIALDLENLVEDLGHRVINVARTHREAIKIARRDQPGLILTDIQLADGSSGLEAANQIVGDFAAPVIVVTAYPTRYLTGSGPEPAFLITKPFGADSLKATISQALFFDQKSHCRTQH